jgi:small subunit ribosomal protein SAe
MTYFFALISNPAFCYLQVDLFFYRDQEEAKELEEAEAVVAPEYGAVAEYIAPPGDTWGGEWGAGEVAPAPVPATGAEWTAASGLTLLLH